MLIYTVVHLQQCLRGTQITRSDYEARGGTNCKMPAQAVAVGVYQFPLSHIWVIAAARPELWPSLYLPWLVLRLHTLCVNLITWLWRSIETDMRLLPNCLFGLNSANFLFGNADLQIPGSTRLHNTICRSLVSHHISHLLRVHMTPPYYILCIYTVPIVCMDRYCSMH